MLQGMPLLTAHRGLCTHMVWSLRGKTLNALTRCQNLLVEMGTNALGCNIWMSTTAGLLVRMQMVWKLSYSIKLVITITDINVVHILPVIL